MMPSRLERPAVPLRPNRLFCADGFRIDPQVSVPMPGGGEVRRDRRAGPAGRSARVSHRIVRVARLAGHRSDGRDAVRQLVQVGFPDDHGAGIAQLFHHERVASGLKALQRERTAGCRHVGRRVVVFDGDGDPVQRPADAARAPLRVERIGDLERPWIERDERVQLGPLLIVGLDPREVLLDDLPRCHAALTHGVLLVEDRCLDDVEPRGGA